MAAQRDLAAPATPSHLIEKKRSCSIRPFSVREKRIRTSLWAPKRSDLSLSRAAGVPPGMRRGGVGWGGEGAPRVWRNSHRRLPRGQCHQAERPSARCSRPGGIPCDCMRRGPNSAFRRRGSLRQRKKGLAKLHQGYGTCGACSWGSITSRVRISRRLESGEGKRGTRQLCGIARHREGAAGGRAWAGVGGVICGRDCLRDQSGFRTKT